MICQVCHEEEAGYGKAVCLNCINGVKKKPAKPAPPKKRGRPKTKTDAEKRENYKKWVSKNRPKLRNYNREYKAHRYVPKKGAWLVYNPELDKFLTSYKWVFFNACYCFKTKSGVIRACEREGGVIVEMKETKEKTLSCWKAEQMKRPHGYEEGSK